MEKILTLNGKINKDANAMYVDSDKGDVLERRNARVMSVDGGDMFVNVSLKGWQSIGTTTGLGTVVGFTEDKKRNWGIYFIQGSVFCSIYAYQNDTDTVIKIISDEGNPFFDFSGVITARMIDDVMVWTDGDVLRHLDIVRALAFTNGSALDWRDAYYSVNDINTRLAIPTPTDNLTAVWGYNSNNLGNNLSNKTWQFAIQYKYKGGAKSCFSGYSPLYVHPSLIAYPSVSEAIKSENYLKMNIPLGSTEVVSTTLLARENQAQWFIVKEFKKLEPTDTVVVDYEFYDHNAREYVSNDTALILNQNVPLKANRIETAKNRLILGDVTVNYDHPSVSLFLTNVKKTISAIGITGNAFSINVTGGRTTSFVIEMQYIASSIVANDIVNFGFDGVFDVAMATPGHWSTFNARYSFAYTGSYLTTDGNVTPILDYIVAQINASGKSLVYDVDVYKPSDGGFNGDYVKPLATKVGTKIVISFVLTDTPESGFGIGGLSLTLNNAYGVKRNVLSPIVSNTFLGGSGYEVGIEYQDLLGNTSGVEGSTSINVPYDETVYAIEDRQYGVNQIRATISGTPPAWAKSYRFVCSSSTSFASVQSFVPLVTYYDVLINEVKTNTSKRSFIVKHNGSLVVALAMPSNFDYQFIEGDFINSKSSFVRTGMKIVGIAPSVTTDLGQVIAGNFLLIATLDAVVNRTGTVITIYRPLKTAQDFIYFHASPLYDIVDGTYSVPTVDLVSGDGWIVQDISSSYTSTTRHSYDAFIETSVLKSGISNKNVGKPTLSLKDFKQIRLQELWYGGQFIDNTGINELRDFSNIGRLAMSESDGIIRGLVMAGDVLKVIQDNRETSVYIGKEQVTNADGSMQLIASQGFLGTINRYTSSYGSQHPQSIVSNDRDVYYFDLDNACVVRTAPNGQFPISSYGLTSYFKEKSQQIRNSIINNLSHQILSYYDRRHNEYVIVFDIPTKSGTTITNHREAVVFDEKQNYWIEYRDLTKNGLIPNMFGTVGQTTLSFTDSTLWLHERTDEYNSMYGENKPLKIVGIANVSPVTEKCLKSISIDANIGFNTTITSPVTENNVIGQETVLYPASYEKRESKLVSPVYQNIRTTEGNNLNQLYDGDDMQGKYFEVSLTQTSNTKIELRNIGVHILSE